MKWVILDIIPNSVAFHLVWVYRPSGCFYRQNHGFFNEKYLYLYR